ncbi:MAG: SGNH/GDSL hydrolase family protein [Opitutaceae bacterium]|jgi:alpha-L-rhamnosidase|nr:SGNH/GDSL hydrolase family protein [Opitutaceae bacterium]
MNPPPSPPRLISTLSARLAIAASLVTASAAGASQLVENLLAGKNRTVVVYGTSLTASGQGSIELGNWLNTLDPSGNAKATIINSGLSSLASQSGLNNLRSKVLDRAPDTVFIEFAMNDAATNFAPDAADYGITVEKSMANLSQMIDDIRKALPDAEIILQTMNPVWDSPNGSGISATIRPDLEAYYEGYRQVSVTYGLLLIDHYKNWVALRDSDPELFKTYVSDGVHPTAAGSTAITFTQLKLSLTATSPVPEPRAWAALAGAVMLALAMTCGRWFTE